MKKSKGQAHKVSKVLGCETCIHITVFEDTESRFQMVASFYNWVWQQKQ